MVAVIGSSNSGISSSSSGDGSVWKQACWVQRQRQRQRWWRVMAVGGPRLDRIFSGSFENVCSMMQVRRLLIGAAARLMSQKYDKLNGKKIRQGDQVLSKWRSRSRVPQRIGRCVGVLPALPGAACAAWCCLCLSASPP